MIVKPLRTFKGICAYIDATDLADYGIKTLKSRLPKSLPLSDMRVQYVLLYNRLTFYVNMFDFSITVHIENAYANWVADLDSTEQGKANVVRFNPSVTYHVAGAFLSDASAKELSSALHIVRQVVGKIVESMTNYYIRIFEAKS